MLARASRRKPTDGRCWLLALPDHVIVHLLLQLAPPDVGHAERRGALAALRLMQTCRRLLRVVESSDEVWGAMVRAEIFLPEADGVRHPSREVFRRLRKLSLTGFWRVHGRYASGEAYTYEMQLCDYPNSCIASALEPGHPARACLESHYAAAVHADVSAADGPRCDWVVGDVAGPWKMRIVAKCQGNLLVFNEVCADEPANGRWVNLCSAAVSSDGTRMEGVWMQTRNGVAIVSPNNSGSFEATLEESPPSGVDHAAWYVEQREARRLAWAGRTEGGVQAHFAAGGHGQFVANGAAANALADGPPPGFWLGNHDNGAVWDVGAGPLGLGAFQSGAVPAAPGAPDEDGD